MIATTITITITINITIAIMFIINIIRWWYNYIIII